MPDQITTVSTSKKFSVDIKDISKALIMAIGGAITDYLYSALGTTGGSFSNIHWADIGKVALIAAFVYLSKNFFTPSQTIVAPAPPAGTTVTVPAPGETTQTPTQPPK
jgi:hypothetical protein